MHRRLALVGAVGAVALLGRALSDGSWPHLAEAYVALAALVIVPLAASLSAPLSGASLAIATSAAAGCAALSFVVDDPRAAGALAFPWLAATLVHAVRASLRWAARAHAVAEERALDAAWLHLAFGAAWLVVARAGLTVAGFSGTVALLTAVHFHYAGFAASTMAGGVGRIVRAGPARRVWSVSAAVVVVGPAIVAIGFTTSPAIEVVAAVALAAAMLALGGVLVATRRVPLILAATGLVVTMALACAYAWGRYTGASTVELSTMARVHGTANALCFALAGVGALALLAPGSRAPAGGRYTRLRAGGFVGADFVERVGAVDDRFAPRGTVDRIADLAWAGFDPAAVDVSVSDFYERVLEHDVALAARWHPLFRPLGRAWRRIARALGQLGLPLDTAGEGMTSRIVPVKASADGRDGARAWIRTWPNGDVLYVAVYATTDGYMNVGLPLPFSSLCTLLRFHNAGRGATVSSHACGGDEGVFWVTRLFAVRLPLDEKLEIGPDAGVLRATHTFTFFGLPFLVLDYTLTRSARAPTPTPTMTSASAASATSARET